MELAVLRMGHRIGRDPRATTHVALTARALGAKKIVICGEKEETVFHTIRSVAKRWGGTFQAEYAKNWKTAAKKLQKQGYCLVHATMYGEPLQKLRKKLAKKRKIAIMVGSEKVPIDVYRHADYNVSVTSQPHSEIAALAVILHEIQRGTELEKKFPNATIRIIPMVRGKKVKN